MNEDFKILIYYFGELQREKPRICSSLIILWPYCKNKNGSAGIFLGFDDNKDFN